MTPSGLHGFLLPATLLLAGALLMVSTAFLESGRHAVQLAEQRHLHRQADELLQQNLKALKMQLEESLSTGGASALTESLSSGNVRMQLITAQGPLALHSHLTRKNRKPAAFDSPLQEVSLEGEWLALGPVDESPLVELAWSAEDLSLLAAGEPPAWWPLPGWSYSPQREQSDPDKVLDDFLEPDGRDLPWIPIGDPLAMSIQHSPALVPILRDAALRFGLFATGTAGSRELTVRIRFYLEGSLWNPYNRPLRLHDGSGSKATFRLAFWNLPELRLHNRSKGISSGWISLDGIRNDFTGSRGIHGFIQLPASLEAGKKLAFLEPAPDTQPEGLARTLHPGFRVGPADSIEIEWRPSDEGIRAGLLSMDIANPVEAAHDGAAWMSLGAMPLSWKNLRFDRADRQPAPFYLKGGSLSFRRVNAQIRISLGNRLLEHHFSDPRRKHLHPDSRFEDATGNWRDGSTGIQADLEMIPDSLSPPVQYDKGPALFSWPASPPQSLLEASDLPAFKEGFRIGSAGAVRLNALIDDRPELLSRRNPEDHVLLDLPDGPEIWRKAVSVNLRDPEAWFAHLAHSASQSTSVELIFPRFPHPEPGVRTDYSSHDLESVREAVLAHCDSVAVAPFVSAGEVFNQGFLDSGSAASDDFLAQLRPLRGYLRKAPPLVRYGSAWRIHAAVRITSPGQVVVKTGRIWLLEKPDALDQTVLEVVHRERTDPAKHINWPLR